MKAASPGETVENWLIRNGQTPRLREMLWDPLALAALNQPPRQAAAPRVRARARRDVRRRSARGGDRAADQAAAPDVRGAGADASSRAAAAPVRTGTPAKILVEAGRRRRGCQAGERAAGTPSAVISAVPWFALARPVRRRAAARLRALLDARARHGVVADRDRESLVRPAACSTSRSSACPAATMQWVFDKRLVFGDERRRICRSCRAARRRLSARTNDELDRARRTSELLDGAARRSRRRALLRATVVREPRATFSLAPGQPARPATETGLRGCFWPATGSRPGCPLRSRARCDRDIARQNSASGNRVIW